MNPSLRVPARAAARGASGATVVMTILVAGWVLFDLKSSSERFLTAGEACTNRSTALSMTKVMMREHLGRPLSARFPNREASSGLAGVSFQYLGDCRHRISAFVDAYYRHNDRTRRYFVVELSNHGEGGWRLDQLDFTEPPRP